MIVYVYRLMRAVVLDRGVFEDVEHDTRAMPQAVLTVLLSSLAAGIGAGGLAGPSWQTLAGVTGVALVTWVAWAELVRQVGTRWWPGSAASVDSGQLLRTLGFAAAPGLLQVFAILQPVAIPVFVASWIWMLAAMVVAVRQAFDFTETWRAAATAALSLGLAVALAAIFGLLFGPAAS